MNQFISRKNSYTVLFMINMAMAVIRLIIFPDQSIFFHVVIFIGAYSFFILGWESMILQHRFFEGIIPFERMPVVRICIQIVLTTIILTILSLIFFSNISRIFQIEIPDLLYNVIYLLNFLLSVIFNVTLFGTMYFYQWRHDLVNKSNLEKEQAIAKYNALKNQLNPHFLFNALTSLNSLIFENQQLASDFLQQLSKVYRYILQSRDKETISISAELKFVEHYIFLLRTRFGKSILINIQVNELDMDKGIVPVLIQMLIENAVKHNVISKEKPLVINISTDTEFLTVENNIISKNKVETSNKMGLENLMALYKYLIDKPIEIKEMKDRFKVRIPLI